MNGLLISNHGPTPDQQYCRLCQQRWPCVEGMPAETDEWDKLVAFFDNLRGHWYTGDSRYPGEKERMMFSADVVRMIVRKFRARAGRQG